MGTRLHGEEDFDRGGGNVVCHLARAIQRSLLTELMHTVRKTNVRSTSKYEVTLSNDIISNDTCALQSMVHELVVSNSAILRSKVTSSDSRTESSQSSPSRHKYFEYEVLVAIYESYI